MEDDVAVLAVNYDGRMDRKEPAQLCVRRRVRPFLPRSESLLGSLPGRGGTG